MISALLPVKNRMKRFIKSQKWKPPEFDVEPDHSSLFEPKMLHTSKLSNPSLYQKAPRKLGPTDIGRVKGFRSPSWTKKNRIKAKKQLKMQLRMKKLEFENSNNSNYSLNSSACGSTEDNGSVNSSLVIGTLSDISISDDESSSDGFLGEKKSWTSRKSGEPLKQSDKKVTNSRRSKTNDKLTLEKFSLSLSAVDDEDSKEMIDDDGKKVKQKKKRLNAHMMQKSRTPTVTYSTSVMVPEFPFPSQERIGRSKSKPSNGKKVHSNAKSRDKIITKTKKYHRVKSSNKRVRSLSKRKRKSVKIPRVKIVRSAQKNKKSKVGKKHQRHQRSRSTFVFVNQIKKSNQNIFKKMLKKKIKRKKKRKKKNKKVEENEDSSMYLFVSCMHMCVFFSMVGGEYDLDTEYSC